MIKSRFFVTKIITNWIKNLKISQEMHLNSINENVQVIKDNS